MFFTMFIYYGYNLKRLKTKNIFTLNSLNFLKRLNIFFLSFSISPHSLSLTFSTISSFLRFFLSLSFFCFLSSLSFFFLVRVHKAKYDYSANDVTGMILCKCCACMQLKKLRGHPTFFTYGNSPHSRFLTLLFLYDVISTNTLG